MKGIGLAKLMKHRTNDKMRLVMRVEGAGNVLLNIPILSNMEVNYHQQKNIQFIGVNAKGPFKPSNFSVQFASSADKSDMYKHLNSAIAEAKQNSAIAEAKLKSTTSEDLLDSSLHY